MAEVSFKVSADIEDAVNKIAFMAKETNNKLESITKGFDQVKGSATALTGAFVFDRILSGLGTIIRGAAEGDEAFQKMRQSLRASGDFTDAAVTSFQKLANEIEATTRFDGDLILSQVGVAKAFNTTNEEAEKLIRAAVELAAETGKSLPEAVQELGKTLTGTTGKLGQTIPALRNFTSEQLTAGAAIDFVANRFRGSAAAATNTFNGAMDRAANAIGKVIDIIGDLVVKNDSVIALINNVTSLAQAIQKSESLQKVIAVVAGGVAALAAFAAGLAGLSAAMSAAGVVAAAFGVTVTAALGPIGLLAAGITAAGAALGYFATQSKGATDRASQIRAEIAELDKRVEALDQRGRQRSLLGGGTDIQEARRQAEIGRAQIAALKEELLKVEAAQRANELTANEFGNAFGESGQKANRVSQELLSKLDQIREKFRNIGDNPAETLRKEYQERQRVLDQTLKAGALQEKEYALLTFNLKRQLDQDLAKLREKDIKEQEKMTEEFFKKHQERLEKLSKNPISILFPEGSNRLGISTGAQEAIATGIGGLSSFLGGAAGAKSLISSTAELAGKAFLGVPGMGEIVKVLAEGPDAVKAMVNEFADAVPDIIEAIIDSIPVLIEALADKMPDIIERLGEKLPGIITRLVEKAPAIAFAVVKSISIELPIAIAKSTVKLIEGSVQFVGKILEGAVQFVGKILAGAGEFVGKILEGAVQFIGRIVEEIGKAFSGIVPGGGGGGIGFGIPGVGGIEIGGGGFGVNIGGDSGISIGSDGASIGGIRLWKGGATEMSQSTSPSISGPSTLVIPITIDRRQLAEAIIDLRRFGYRLEPA